jgi:amidase
MKTVAGPLANCVQDLEEFMKVVLTRSPEKYDAGTITGDWRVLENEFPGVLNIGILPADPEYILMPPVRRTMEEAINKLKAAGHNIIHLSFDEDSSAGLGGRIAFQWYELLHSFSGSLEDHLGEPLVTSVARNVHPFTNHKPPVNTALDCPTRIAALKEVTQDYRAKWEELWRRHALDAVLSPASNTTAVPHDDYGVPVYTCMWNVLDVRDTQFLTGETCIAHRSCYSTRLV